jgi:hypothetical protein
MERILRTIKMSALNSGKSETHGGHLGERKATLSFAFLKK